MSQKEKIKVFIDYKDGKTVCMLVKEEFVEGLSVKRAADGDYVLNVSSPRITTKGLEYLKENSLMKKAAHAAKGISEIIP